MTNSVRRFLLAILLPLTLCYTAQASHHAGHDLTYIYLGDSAGLQHYRVTLTILQDCLNGSPGAIAQDNPAFIGIFKGTSTVEIDTNALMSADVPLPISRFGPCDSSWSSVPGCINKVTFTRDYYLTPSSVGYTISYQRCCMNASITNVLDAGNYGTTATCNIPPSGIASNNNSSVFINYPPYVIADNFPLVFDCSATDPDGDSLSYTLCSALLGAIDPSNAKPYPIAPPYDSVAYISPLSSTNPIIASVPFSIDPVTGLLTGTPSAPGRYLVNVRCNEWRGGVTINSTQRDFEVIVFNCFAPLTRQAAQIGPNPVTNTLTITSNNDITNITVFNSGGGLLKQSWTHSVLPTGLPYMQQATIDVSLLGPGQYYVKVNDGDAIKFIKQY